MYSHSSYNLIRVETRWCDSDVRVVGVGHDAAVVGGGELEVVRVDALRLVEVQLLQVLVVLDLAEVFVRARHAAVAEELHHTCGQHSSSHVRPVTSRVPPVTLHVHVRVCTSKQHAFNSIAMPHN